MPDAGHGLQPPQGARGAVHAAAVRRHLRLLRRRTSSFVGDAFIEQQPLLERRERRRHAAMTDVATADYRATTILYAMGITQHTCGAQNIKGFAVLQTLLGNMGRAGGGINALRGIHNVQGSTDMGLLYGNIPGYSGNPTVQVDASRARPTRSASTWTPVGQPALRHRQRAPMNGSYDDAYNTAAMALQQRGFYNMTLQVVRRLRHAARAARRGQARQDRCAATRCGPRATATTTSRCSARWPPATTKAARRLGSEPRRHRAEPGRRSATGLKNLDLLVVRRHVRDRDRRSASARPAASPT